MKLLLDTHAVIWWVDQDHLPSPVAHSAIGDPANEILLSAATIWEIAIKVGLAKLTLSLPYRQWLEQTMAALGVTVLPVAVEYADVQTTLPFHHRDPFDRLLIAQAVVENVPVVSRDAVFDRYGVTRVWE